MWEVALAEETFWQHPALKLELSKKDQEETPPPPPPTPHVTDTSPPTRTHKKKMMADIASDFLSGSPRTSVRKGFLILFILCFVYYQARLVFSQFHGGKKMSVVKSSVLGTSDPDECLWLGKDQRWAASHTREGTLVVVSEPHNAALRHWLDAVESRRLPRTNVRLVHVDSHSDLLIESSQAFPTLMKWPFPRGAEENAAFAMNHHIGTFIVTAIGLCIVDEMIWIRSDFTVGTYNPPECGEYKVELTRHAHGQFCFNTLESKRVVNDGKNNLACAGAVESGESLEDAWNEDECYESKPLRGSRSQHNVFDLVVAPIPNMSPLLAKRTAKVKPWILDIDMDYFTVVDPQVTILGWLGLERNAVRELQRCGRRTLATLKGCDVRKISFDQAVLRLSEVRSLSDAQRLFDCRGLRDVTARDAKDLAAGGSFLQDCAPRWAELGTVMHAKAYKRVIDSSDELSNLFWVGGSAGEPHHVSTRDEMRNALSKLADFIRSQPSSPDLITIVQSYGNAAIAEDGYVPAEDAKWLEESLLDMLRTLVNVSEVKRDNTHMERPDPIGVLSDGMSKKPKKNWLH